MSSLARQGGQIVPNPENADNEQVAKSQAAMDFFRKNAERMRHFSQRAEELGRTGQDTVITLVNVDAPMGGELADILMPGHDWQRYRDAGEIPMARGLAVKSVVSEFLAEVGCETAAGELSATDDLRVVIVDAGVALVLDVAFDAQ